MDTRLREFLTERKVEEDVIKKLEDENVSHCSCCCVRACVSVCLFLNGEPQSTIYYAHSKKNY